jgi:hypothetical protein
LIVVSEEHVAFIFGVKESKKPAGSKEGRVHASFWFLA